MVALGSIDFFLFTLSPVPSSSTGPLVMGEDADSDDSNSVISVGGTVPSDAIMHDPNSFLSIPDDSDDEPGFEFMNGGVGGERKRRKME